MISNFTQATSETQLNLYISQDKISMLGLKSFTQHETSKNIKCKSDYGLISQ